MPNPVVAQYKTTVAKKSFQVKKKRPTMASAWKNTMNIVVVQLRRSDLWKIISSVMFMGVVTLIGVVTFCPYEYSVLPS